MGDDTAATGQKGRAGYWVAMLFGLVFFGIGAAFLVFGVIPNLWDAMRMQDWVPVPAEIAAVDLETNHSDDSTTYKVNARFHYTYNGRNYTGARVGIADGGSDNVGEWQRDTYNRLRGRKQTTLWVNPENPSEAVYDRELRWGLLGFKLIFVVVFGGFGAGVIWFINRKPRPVPPGLPEWQARAEWHDNRIRSSARSTLWFAWGFAVFWNAISSPVLFILPGELAKGNQIALVALLFPLVGLGLLVWAVRQTLAWRRFGITELQLDPFPGAIGGDVGGTVEMRLGFNPKYRLHVTLTCHHVYRRRSGRNGSETVRDVRWQDEQLAEVQPGLHGTRLRFLFQTPQNLPGSSTGGNSWDEWTVNINAELPGADFDRSWEIPVFRDAGPQTAREPLERRGYTAEPLEPAGRLVRIRETGAGVELYYPYLRHPGLAFTTLTTGASFAGFAWLFRTAAAGDRVNAPIPFIWLFTAIGVLICLWGIYLLGNSLRVTAGRQGLSVVRGILGLHLVRQAPAGEITGIDKSIGMQFRHGNRSHAYYNIRVHTRDGRRITAGTGLSGASRVNEIIERLRTALGLPASAIAPEPVGSAAETSQATLSESGMLAARRRGKRIRVLAQAAAGALFLIIFIWNFRNVLFG